jgi:hypothetical protein
MGRWVNGIKCEYEYDRENGQDHEKSQSVTRLLWLGFFSSDGSRISSTVISGECQKKESSLHRSPVTASIVYIQSVPCILVSLFKDLIVMPWGVATRPSSHPRLHAP